MWIVLFFCYWNSVVKLAKFASCVWPLIFTSSQTFSNCWIPNSLLHTAEQAVAVRQLAEALRYKAEGRGFDWVIGICHCLNPSGRTVALDSTQPLTEISTRNISWGYRRTERRVYPTTFVCTIVLKSGSIKLLESSGFVVGQYRNCFSFCVLIQLVGTVKLQT